jgi:hypothetical protein
MYAISFTKRLPLKYKKDLEEIFFFNPYQKNYSDRIRKAIDQFGSPKISVKGDSVEIVFNDTTYYKSLYVFDSDSENAALLGLLIYELKSNQCTIIHLAIHELCNAKNDLSGEHITLRMIEKLRREIIQIKEIKSIYILYNHTRLPINVRLIDAWV